MLKSLIDSKCFWTIPIGGFIANFIVGGIAKSFGIIMSSTKDLFYTDSASLTLAGGLIYTFMYCFSIVGLTVCQKYGSRIAVSIGGLGCVLSFLSAFLATNVTWWVISIGCGIGISLAFIYSPVFITLSRCFRRRIGVAVGITVAGSSVGQMLFPTIISYVIDKYSGRSVFLFSAFLCCHFFVTAALMPRYELIHEVNRELKSTPSTCNSIDDERYFKRDQIIMLVIFITARVFGDIGDIGVGFALPLYGESTLELSNREISLAIGLAGFIDLITRLGVGVIIDQPWCPRSLLLALAWLVESINTILILSFSNKICYFISYGIYGFSSGVAVTLIIVVLNDFVGKINFAKSFVVMTFVLGLLIGPGQFLMGYINDVTGNYVSSMWFLGINLFVAFVIMTLEYPTRLIFPSPLDRTICTICAAKDSVDDLDSGLYDATRALGNMHTTFLRISELNTKTRYETYLLFSEINANDFLPTSALL